MSSNIANLEHSLANLFETASEWNDGIVVHESDIESIDIRDIRTDITSMLGSRPSGN